MSRDLLSKRTIAIIVEHEVTRRLISHVLEEEGFRVIRIDEMSHVVDCVIPEQPAVILLDAQLTKVDSYVLCREFSGRAGLEDTRIIMFGNQCTSIERLAGLREGADDFISGPFDYRELLARIDKPRR